MDGIKIWAFSVCAAVVAAAIAHMMIPNSGIRKIINITVSIFVLCAVFSPVVLNLGDFDYDTIESPLQTTQELQQIYDAQVISGFKAEIKGAVESEFEKKGITGAKIAVSVITGEGHRIYINEITVNLSEKYSKREGEIKSIVAKLTGVTPDVVCGE